MEIKEMPLLSLGEAFDGLKPGLAAISLHPKDKGAVLKFNEERWLVVKYPGEKYYSKQIQIRHYSRDEAELKRWIIIKEEDISSVEERLNAVQ
jgi:hypothetical protein